MLDHICDLIESLTPIVWVRTIEEERFLKEILLSYKNKPETNCFVHRRTQGRQEAANWLSEYQSGNVIQQANTSTTSINSFMDGVYREGTEKLKNVYFICNANEHMEDPMFRRRLTDHATQQLYVDTLVKIIVLVSCNIEIPVSLSRYIQVVDFDLMSKKEIVTYLEYIEDEAKAGGQEKLDDMNISMIADALKGLTQLEIASIAQYSIKKENLISQEAINLFKQRAAKRSEFLVPLERDLDFSKIGGQERLKEFIQIAGMAFTTEGKDAGLPKIRGVLILGPPGTGKSLNAKATCTELGIPGFHFDPSKLFAGRVGESESRTRAAIRDLEANAPCVVFIDEIEKGFSGTESSGSSDAGTTARVVGTFLNWMQEHDSAVLMMATANDITKMPSEMIQRFDEVFYVDAPNKKILAKIIHIHLQKYGVKNINDFDCEELAENSQKLVGREIDQGVKSAQLVAFYQKRPLNQEILNHVFQNKVPLVDTMSEKILELKTWVGHSEEKNDGIRARFANHPAIFGVKPELKVI